MAPELREFSEQIRLHAQKHILPLYRRDEGRGLLFEATLSLVKYKNSFFGLTASHAVNLDQELYINDTNILKYAKVHKFNQNELDLAIFDFANQQIENRLYFDLDSIPDYSLYNQQVFSWSGFPAKKATNFYKKTPEIIKKLTEETKNNGLITTSKTLSAGIEFVESFNPDSDEIIGFKNLENIEYSKEGHKNYGYSLRGMSGGILCLHKLNPFPINQSLVFIGIGTDHKKDNTIIGISRKKIIEKLNEIISQPCEIMLVLDPNFTKDPVIDFIIELSKIQNSNKEDKDAIKEWIIDGIDKILLGLKMINDKNRSQTLFLDIKSKLNESQLNILNNILHEIKTQSLTKYTDLLDIMIETSRKN